MKNLKTFGQLNESDSEYPEGLRKTGEHDSKYDALVGRTWLVFDTYNGKSKQMGKEEVITSVDSDGGIESKDYPTKHFFSNEEDFNSFMDGKVAWIHPGEVYAFLKPENN